MNFTKHKPVIFAAAGLTAVLITASVAIIYILVSGNGQSATVTAEDTSADSEVYTSVVADTVRTGDHDDIQDYEWDQSEVQIVALNGSSVTIDSAGTYSLSGSIADGQVVVDTQDTEIVRLILNGVTINNDSGSAIMVENAEKVMLVLADGITNSLSDGTNYTLEADSDEPNATIFSKSDLTIYGEGSLEIAANYNDAIASKDGLIIASGSIRLSSVDDGIRGKDYLIIKDADVDVTAEGDGLKSDNETEEMGYIRIDAGSFKIDAGGDGITAQTQLVIAGGDFDITTGGGADSTANYTESSKGLKSAFDMQISAGVFTINSADDAVHANSNIQIDGGTFTISTGDDGLHADESLAINTGTFNITESYEGIESAAITINGGNYTIVSSDDAINVAGGVDSSGMGGPGGFGRDRFAAVDSGYYLEINGGEINVDGQGDGVDVNGNVTMNGGTLLITGPTSNGNGALDYDGSFAINGGTLIAVGSSGMAMAPDTSSQQNSLLVNMTSAASAGTTMTLTDSSGRTVVSYTPTRAYQSVAISAPGLTTGQSYNLNIGNSTYETISLTGTVTTSGSGGMGGFGGPPGMR